MCDSYEINRRDTTIKISKKGNKKVDAVIETFGGLEVATVIVFCAALFAIWKLYRKAKKYIIEQYQRQKSRSVWIRLPCIRSGDSRAWICRKNSRKILNI